MYYPVDFNQCSTTILIKKSKNCKNMYIFKKKIAFSHGLLKEEFQKCVVRSWR